MISRCRQTLVSLFLLGSQTVRIHSKLIRGAMDTQGLASFVTETA